MYDIHELYQLSWCAVMGGSLVYSSWLYISESNPWAMLLFIYSLLNKLVTTGESNHLPHTSTNARAQNKQNKTWGPISILTCLYRPFVDVLLHNLDAAICRVADAPIIVSMEFLEKLCLVSAAFTYLKIGYTWHTIRQIYDAVDLN